MNCLIADDEPLILKDIHRTAKSVLGEDTEFFLAADSREALHIIEEQNASGKGIQIAFLDIEMPYLSGMEAAKKIQAVAPHTNIIFVTGYGKYALDVLDLYVSGFILKPVNEKNMRKAIENLRYPIPELTVQCFGRFEVFYGGTPVNFKRSQCKEIFAYLIDKRGTLVSEDELRYLLWTEEEDTEKKRRYVRNIISDIRVTLKGFGVDDVIVNNGKGYYGINKEKISCDLYDYLDRKGKPDRKETGSYMEQYPWAEL
ncbi:MAG: response regulator [Parasporobacterium sp.]|nr:response regulator [Parasporobacterium sp.]